MGLIVGCTIGGLAVVTLAAAAVMYCRRRRSRVNPIMEGKSFFPFEHSLSQHSPIAGTQMCTEGHTSHEAIGLMTSIPVPTPLVISPSKAIREAMNGTRLTDTLSDGGGAAEGSETNWSSHDTSGTVAYISGLREEMNNLRRDIQHIRELRSDLPPVYQAAEE